MHRAFVHRLGVLAAISVLVATALVLDTGPALADADCDQTARTADLMLTQTIALTGYAPNGDWLISKHVVSRNDGPCQVHDVTFLDVAPAGSTVLSVSTNPAGWTCMINGTTVTCVSTASVGVPGVTDFFIDLQMPPVTSASTDVTDAASISTTDAADPDPANNRSWAGIVGEFGGTIGTGSPTGTANCPNPFCQFEQVRMPSVGGPGSWRAVYLNEANGACTSSGFGRCVQVTSGSTTDYQLKTFIINLEAATAAGVPFGAISLVNAEDGSATFSDVPTCSMRADIDPCIVESTKIKVGGATFVVFTARTREDDGWGWDD